MLRKDIADTKIKLKILINHCILGLIINNLSGKNIIQKVPKSWRSNEQNSTWMGVKRNGPVWGMSLVGAGEGVR